MRSSDGYAEATAALSRALELGLPHPLIEREAAVLLAETGYRSGDLAAVERAAAVMMRPDQPAVIRLFGADWLERLHWKRTGEVPPAPLRPPAAEPADPAAPPSPSQQ
jgi:hypothetical protein